MNPTTRLTLLAIVIAAIAAVIVVKKRRDPFPDEGDAFAGDTPPPGDGMSMQANAEAAG